MPIGTDKRLYERIEGELGIRYSPQGTNREFCTTTKNISGGGIRITLLKKLDVGMVLDLEIFKYSQDLKTRCRGKIVWVWEKGMQKKDEQYLEAGVEFLDKNLLYIGKLISYLRTQNPEDNT